MAVIVFDYFAVLIAAVVCFLFGWAWHSPYLFGNMMKKENKKKKLICSREKRNEMLALEETKK